MTLAVTGRIIAIEPIVQVSEKFAKREFVIELSEEINGNVYVNYGKFQLTQGKCSVMDNFQVGNHVEVSFNVKGNSYVDKKDGRTKYITNLDAWKVMLSQPGAAGYTPPATALPTAYAAAPGNTQPPQPQYAGYKDPTRLEANGNEAIDELPF